MASNDVGQMIFNAASVVPEAGIYNRRYARGSLANYYFRH